jgi:hypothetical protein
VRIPILKPPAPTTAPPLRKQVAELRRAKELASAARVFFAQSSTYTSELSAFEDRDERFGRSRICGTRRTVGVLLLRGHHRTPLAVPGQLKAAALRILEADDGNYWASKLYS